MPRRSRELSSSSSGDETVFAPELKKRPRQTPSVEHNLAELTTIVTGLAEAVRYQAETASSSRSPVPPATTQVFRGDAVPPFTPEDPNHDVTKWIRKLDELRNMFQWSEETTIYYALGKLRGLAATWYSGLPSLNFTWSEWKEKLVRAFPNQRDYAAQLEEMLRRKKRPDEDMAKYFYEKNALVAACDIKGTKAVSCIIHGIPDEQIQNAARAGHYSDPEALFEYLRTCKEQVFKPQLHKKQNFHKYQNNRARQDNRHPSNRNTNLVKCYQCNEIGHIARNCHKTQLYCKICRRPGHIDKDCRSKPKPIGTTLIMNEESTSANEKFFVDAFVNRMPIRSYVDFGSGCIAIRESEIARLQLPIDAHRKKVIRGYGNGHVNTLGTTRFTLRVDEAVVDVNADIVPDSDQVIPLIIGQPFTESKNVVVHKDHRRLKITSTKCALTDNGSTTKPTTLWAKKAIVIPPNHVGHVHVGATDGYVGDLYVEAKIREQGDQKSCIPEVMLRMEPEERSVIPVINLSNHNLTIKKQRTVAQGWPCIQADIENDAQQAVVLRTKATPIEPLQMTDIQIGPVTSEDQRKVWNLLNRYRDCFAQNINELGCAKSTEMKITLDDNKVVSYRPYRLSASQREQVRIIVQELLGAGIIRESNSPFTSPILLVKKKTGEDRMCVDYRKLNNQTVKDHYPLPRIDDQIDRLHGCKFFTSLDLCNGYHQIPVSEECKHLTSFITPDGQFEYNRMPFGLANAPSVFQRLINKILGSMRYDAITVYLDDILIPSKTVEEGLAHLEEVLKVLRDEGLTLKLSKCQFLATSVTYLGFHINEDGVRPGDHKARALQEFPVPTDVHRLRQFLGLATYFRQFIPNFAIIAKPLTMLTRKSQCWKWGQEQTDAFDHLRKILAERPVLAIFSQTAETEVHTDASKLGVAGILLQKQKEDKLQPVAYYSRQTSKCEQNYHSYELEVLAAVESIRKFRVYLLGRKFKLKTDCNAMKTAQTKRDLNAKIARWWLELADYDFTIEYRPGQKMAHVDALSRNPPTTTTSSADASILHIREDDWILAGQLSDAKLRNIREALMNPAGDEKSRDVHKEYELRDGRIYKKTVEGKRWVVPQGMRRAVTKMAHDDMEHFAVDKTLQKLKENYWFNNMRSYVTKYIKCCIPCLYNKKTSGPKQGFLHPIEKISVPFHTIHLDHLGPFTVTKKKNTHIIVAVEGFTKYLLMKPVRNTGTRAVIKFIEEIIVSYGVPTRVITDRGTAFTAKKFKNFCKGHGIIHILNAVATPRSNGQVERFNRVIRPALAASSADDDSWDSEVANVQFAVNNTINKTTKRTASELLFGYKPRAPSDAILTAELEQIHKVIQDITEVRTEASERIKNAQETQKQQFDEKRIKPRSYKVGDLILTEKANAATGTSRKLLPPFAGPFCIKTVLPNDTYENTDLPGSSRRKRGKYNTVVAVDRMRPWIPEHGMSDTDNSSSSSTFSTSTSSDTE